MLYSILAIKGGKVYMGKRNKFNKIILSKVKTLSDIEIDSTIRGKCLFLCYQPKIPKKLKKVK